MRSRSSLLAVLGLSVLLCAFVVMSGGGARAGGDAKETKAIQAILDAQVVSWNKGDLEGFLSGYWQSPDVSFYSGKNRFRGYKELLERFKNQYQGTGKEMGKLAFSAVDIEMLGKDHAIARGGWELVMKGETKGGLFTLVFKKTDAGWRITHDHTSY